MAIYQFNDDVITIQLFLSFSKQKTAASWSGIDAFPPIQSGKKNVTISIILRVSWGQTIKYIATFSPVHYGI